MIMLTHLMHLSAFFFFTKLGVDLIPEKAKPQPYLYVLLICAKICGARLARFVYCALGAVRYHKRMKDPLRGKM